MCTSYRIQSRPGHRSGPTKSSVAADRTSTGWRAFVSDGRASADPIIDFGRLELPESADLVSRHAFVGDPGVDRVLRDSQVGRDVFCGQPGLRHLTAPRLLTRFGRV